MLKTKKLNSNSTVGVADDANYFMPKIQKLRPDGASLTSVYESKKQDLWGQIIKAQVIEDVSSILKNYLSFNKQFAGTWKNWKEEAQRRN